MDCFASLAMTRIGRSVLDTLHAREMTVAIEPEAYPCGVTEILAQSRRPISTVSATVKASAATLASMR
jgi:hypothetical protein